MVCEKCEKKKMKGKGEKSAARSRTYEAEGARDNVGANKLLANKKYRFQPYAEAQTQFKKCRMCRQHVHSVGWNYCQNCAYKNGVCAMCGVRMYNVKQYVQRTV